MTRRAARATTPEMVIDAAAAIFTEIGYANTTLDMIGRRLGMTRQGVLHYFPSKDEVFAAVIGRERRWADEIVHDQPAVDDVLGALRALRGYIGATEESLRHVRLVQVLHSEAIAGNEIALAFTRERLGVVRAHLFGIVSTLHQAGALAAPWTVDSATDSLMAVIHGLQARALVDATAAVGDAFDRFTSAICAPELVDARRIATKGTTP